jgi:hypothetical protein
MDANLLTYTDAIISRMLTYFFGDFATTNWKDSSGQ